MIGIRNFLIVDSNSCYRRFIYLFGVHMNKFPMYIVLSETDESLEAIFSTEEQAEAYRAQHDPEYQDLWINDIICEADLDQYLEDYHGLLAENKIEL